MDAETHELTMVMDYGDGGNNAVVGYCEAWLVLFHVGRVRLYTCWYRRMEWGGVS